MISRHRFGSAEKRTLKRVPCVVRGLFKTALFACFFMAGCQRSVESSVNTEPQKPLQEYTAENPREWQKEAPSHLPHGRMNLNGDHEIFVYLEPGASGEFHKGHYIEKIGIMDQDGRTIAVKEFKPGHHSPYTASFKLPPGSYRHYKLFSRCNLHDLWSAPFMPVRP